MRRNVPCQDASQCATLRSADGLPVGLMAVADGHGGSRYWLSDVGSRLACELAIALAREDLSRRRLGGSSSNQLEELHSWLAHKLPEQLVRAWEKAVEADWQQRQRPAEHRDEPFSSQTYGSTLALVVMTPHWWGHTGLGDWDLVLLSNNKDQPDRILSQEADQGLQGEATESLCLTRASRCFAARTALYPLTGSQREACGLVLSTDGIRKSCATDADHLALCRYLLEEAQPGKAQGAGSTERLDTSLDRISREGSGDDVSVALACFGTLQPRPPAPAAERATPASAAPVLPELPEQPLEGKPQHQQPKSSRANSQQKPQQPTAAATGLKPWQLSLAVGLIGIAGLAAGAWFWLKAPTARQAPMRSQAPATASIALTDLQTTNINSEVKVLCQMDGSLINSNLAKRKEIIKSSQSNPRILNQLLANSDWRGSIIVLYKPGNIQSAQLTSPCPSLSTALSSYWSQQTLDTRTNTPIQQSAESSE